MRIVLAISPLALIAACSGGGDNASGNGAEPAANQSAPAGNTAAPPPANAAEPAAGDPARENEVAECSDDIGGEVPAGTDVAALCGCAIDRIAAGTGQNEALESCAAGMGVTLAAEE